MIGESASGASAVSQVRALRPQVVLLDILLPDIDGFAVAELIARETAAPRVVLTSSREASEFGKRLRRTSADGFLGKAELSGAAVRALTGVTPC